MEMNLSTKRLSFFIGFLCLWGIVGCSEKLEVLTDSTVANEPPCSVNGTLVNGVCVCISGYEGERCGDQINTKFGGVYSAVETCSNSGANGPYSIAVTASVVSANGLTFSGFWSLPGSIASGTVSLTSSLSFSIDKQPYTSSIGNFMIQASGDLDTLNHVMAIQYIIYNSSGNSVLDNCSVSMMLQ